MLKIAENPELAEDITTDHSKLKTQVITNYIFKTLKISSNLMLSSYILGIIFYIYADILQGE